MTVSKYLLSKNVKNRYFVAIFVNIVFFCSSLIPTKCLYVSTISVAKHSIKSQDYVFSFVSVINSRIFSINGVNSRLIINELSLRKISATTTHA